MSVFVGRCIPRRKEMQALLLDFFFFNDTATTEIYTLSLHDALPISVPTGIGGCSPAILKQVGCSSGMSPIFPQVDRSRTLRSEPFSSRLATDQRSKNSCA